MAIPKDVANAIDEKAQKIIREFNALQGKRGVFESHWQEIAERIWPQASRTFNPYWYNTPGEKKNEFVFDSTASLALNRFASILDSLLTPRQQIWHALQCPDDRVNDRRDVKLYFEKVTQILFDYRYAYRANFSSQNNYIFKSLGAFGTGAMFIDELDGAPGLRYKAMPLGEVYFSENHQGMVDKAYRIFRLTARQATQIQKWDLPKSIIEKAKTAPDDQFEFIHQVEPNREQDYGRSDYKGMAYSSCYVSKTEGKVVEEGGYTTFPYIVPRYEQAPNEVYGRSIAMDLLPAIKTLNEEKKAMLKQGHRVLDPVLMGPDDGVLDAFSMLPGALNAGGVTPDGRPLIHALPTGNVQAGKELMDDERSLINDGFLVSLFQILVENPQQTATEVLERAREKGILLSPSIGRQQSEYLGPTIDREIDVLNRQGLLPQMPEALRQAQGKYKVQYDSPLNRLQKSEQPAGLSRTLESLLPIAQAAGDPSLFDFFDWDTIIPDVSGTNGVPYKWMKSIDQVMAMRQNRQMQQQQQTMIDAAPGAAAMMSSVAKLNKA